MRQINLSANRKRLRHGEQTCGRWQGRSRGREVCGFGLSVCKLLHALQNGWQGPPAQHKELYSQCPGINHNGEEYVTDRQTDGQIKLNHFAIQQKLTQHCKVTILQIFLKNGFSGLMSLIEWSEGSEQGSLQFLLLSLFTKGWLHIRGTHSVSGLGCLVFSDLTDQGLTLFYHKVLQTLHL